MIWHYTNQNCVFDPSDGSFMGKTTSLWTFHVYLELFFQYDFTTVSTGSSS